MVRREIFIFELLGENKWEGNMKRVVSEPIPFYWLGLGGICGRLNSSEQMAADAVVLPCSCIFAIVE